MVGEEMLGPRRGSVCVVCGGLPRIGRTLVPHTEEDTRVQSLPGQICTHRSGGGHY